ncbi:MAG TPA: hypothetical protein DCZ03_09545 [Gammaproteobacteria bacterium]|nr:hypothetical protein [Gammaproteobacteria bacterium]
MIIRLTIGIFVGITVATLAALLMIISFTGNEKDTIVRISALAFIGVWLGSIVLSVYAKNGFSAAGRMLLIGAVLIYALPLATFVFSGQQISSLGANPGVLAGIFAAMSALVGGIIGAVSGILGFILGTLALFSGVVLVRVGQMVDDTRRNPSKEILPEE